MLPANLVCRDVTCPLCGGEFEFYTPRSHSYSLIRRDSDFCPYYTGVNPTFYVVWVCPVCHFAAYKHDFKQLEDASREALRAELSRCHLGDAVSFRQPERSHFAALRSFELAQVCYRVRGFGAEVQAGLALRAAWVCRYAKELRREVLYLASARDLYKEAFERGVALDRNVDDLAIAYLIGELMLRTGDVNGAQAYFMLLLQAPDTKERLERFAQDRLFDSKAAIRNREVLATLPLFEPLTPEHLGLLAVNSERLKLQRGAVLCQKGDPGDSMFVIASGHARVFLEEPDHCEPVAILGPGDAVGEMSLFLGAPRTATVLAGEDGKATSSTALEVIEIAKAAFRNILMLEPKVARALAKLIGERRQQNEALQVQSEAPPEEFEAAAVTTGAAGDSAKAPYSTILAKIWTIFGMPE